MPSKSSKQKALFQKVVAVQRGEPSPSSYVTKVANSIGKEDAKHFANALSEKVDLKTKKAIVAVLKDIREPMYLNEEDEEQDTIDAVATSFHKKEVWSKYIRMYIGQPLAPKEIESLGNFKEKKPTNIARTEIWYNTTGFAAGASRTTVIKKMKDSGQFSFVAFTKQERVESDKEKEEPGVGDMGGAPPDLGLPPITGTEPMGTPIAPIGEVNISMPSNSTTTSTGTVPSPEQKKKEEEEKDDIIITKSILFKDEIKGAAILIEFLKKLNL